MNGQRDDGLPSGPQGPLSVLPTLSPLIMTALSQHCADGPCTLTCVNLEQLSVSTLFFPPGPEFSPVMSPLNDTPIF